MISYRVEEKLIALHCSQYSEDIWYRLSLLESPNTSPVRTPKSTARGRMRSKLLFTFRDNRYALFKVICSLHPLAFMLTSNCLHPFTCYQADLVRLPFERRRGASQYQPFYPCAICLKGQVCVNCRRATEF